MCVAVRYHTIATTYSLEAWINHHWCCADWFHALLVPVPLSCKYQWSARSSLRAVLLLWVKLHATTLQRLHTHSVRGSIVPGAVPTGSTYSWGRHHSPAQISSVRGARSEQCYCYGWSTTLPRYTVCILIWSLDRSFLVPQGLVPHGFGVWSAVVRISQACTAHTQTTSVAVSAAYTGAHTRPTSTHTACV